MKFVRYEVLMRMDGIVLKIVDYPDDNIKRSSQLAWLYRKEGELVGAIVKVSAVNNDEAVELATVAMFGRKTR